MLKAVTAKASIAGLQECREALGGVGYLENEDSQHINVARVYRDCNVLSIWEGTTNVLATDFVGTFKGRNGQKTLTAFHSWLNNALFGGKSEGYTAFSEEKRHILDYFEVFRADIGKKGLEELLVRAREVMERLATIIMATLMIVDAERDG